MIARDQRSGQRPASCKPLLVKLAPNAGLLPASQAAPSRHPAAEPELLRQMLPTDPCVQDDQDSLQHQPIVQRPPTRITVRVPGAPATTAPTTPTTHRRPTTA